jgi:Protein of unknown function DUF2834
MMSLLRIIYLVLAIWGAAQPMFYLVPWVMSNGFEIRGLFVAWQIFAANTGMMLTLNIAVIALSVFVIAETAVRRNWGALVVLPVTFLIGLNCGLPLYLFLRSRPVS